MTDNNNAYPLVTSTNSTGDTATQGFNTDVLESLDPANRQIVTDNLGLINTGKDVFYGSDFVHPEHIPQLADALSHVTGKDDKTDLHKIAHILIEAHKQIANATWHRQAAPNQVITGGVYFPNPVGAGSTTAGSVPSQVLSYDPKRYRVTLHPKAFNADGTDATPGRIWIGQNQGDVNAAAGGQGAASAFPLTNGNANANDTIDFYWGDTMFAALDAQATTATWLFYVIERYAD